MKDPVIEFKRPRRGPSCSGVPNTPESTEQVFRRRIEQAIQDFYRRQRARNR